MRDGRNRTALAADLSGTGTYFKFKSSPGNHY